MEKIRMLRLPRLVSKLLEQLAYRAHTRPTILKMHEMPEIKHGDYSKALEWHNKHQDREWFEGGTTSHDWQSGRKHRRCDLTRSVTEGERAICRNSMKERGLSEGLNELRVNIQMRVLVHMRRADRIIASQIDPGLWLIPLQSIATHIY